MPAAVVPRQLSIAAWLHRTERRVRRLEVNHDWPPAGTAIYAAAYSLGATATWTPDFTGATSSQADQIGLTLAAGGVIVPAGWLCWLTFGFSIDPATPPPTGESVTWGVAAGNGGAISRTDVMLNTAQNFADTVPAPAGWAGSGLPVSMGVVSTAMGTEFTPESMYVAAVGIELPTNGWPPGSVE